MTNFMTFCPRHSRLKHLWLLSLAFLVSGCLDGAGDEVGGIQIQDNSEVSAFVQTVVESPNGLSISNTLPAGNQWDILTIGKQVYADRNFTYTTVPNGYVGYPVLRTRNDDKRSAGNSVIQFTVNREAAVYVARDTRITTQPSWMNDWSDTGEFLITGDATLRIYRKVFPQGRVVLGGNQGTALHSMYTVLVAGLQTLVDDDTSPEVVIPPEDVETGDVETGPVDLSITNTAPGAYQWDTLANGKRVYTDRVFTYTATPAGYTGHALLRTRNNDKSSTGNSLIRFTVNQAVTVYVARDVRAGTLPSWMNGWVDTGQSLVTSDTTLRLYRREFPQGGVVLGGNQGTALHSMYTVLVAALPTTAEPGDGTPPGGGGTGGVNTIPVAANDNAATPMNTPVVIDVLANDRGLTDAPMAVSIITSPAHGQAQVTQGTVIRYTPAAGYSGTDSFNYRVQDANGDFSTASVTIEVICNQCATGVAVEYAWGASSGPVSGYRIYQGESIGTATRQVTNIPVGAPGFNGQAPSIRYDAWNDLGLAKGQVVCLRVKAYNAAGESPFSAGVCDAIPQ